MRGEEFRCLPTPNGRLELPPHALRRAQQIQIGGIIQGITSACAEKSDRKACQTGRYWNYLRMRGEETALPAETLAVGVVL